MSKHKPPAFNTMFSDELVSLLDDDQLQNLCILRGHSAAWVYEMRLTPGRWDEISESMYRFYQQEMSCEGEGVRKRLALVRELSHHELKRRKGSR